MDYKKIISTDGKSLSLSRVGVLFSLLVIFVVSLLSIVGIIDSNLYRNLSDIWVKLLLTFISYRGVGKITSKINRGE
jgi:hypothetical protein